MTKLINNDTQLLLINFGKLIFNPSSNQILIENKQLSNPKFFISYLNVDLQDKFIGKTKTSGKPNTYDTFEDAFKVIYNRALNSENLRYTIFATDSKFKLSYPMCAFEVIEESFHLQMFTHNEAKPSLYDTNFKQYPLNIYDYPIRNVQTAEDLNENLERYITSCLPTKRKTSRKNKSTLKSTPKTAEIEKKKEQKRLEALQLKEQQRVEALQKKEYRHTVSKLKSLKINNVEYNAKTNLDTQLEVSQVVLEAFANINDYMRKKKIRGVDFTLDTLRFESNMRFLGSYSRGRKRIRIKVTAPLEGIPSTIFHEYGHHIYYTILYASMNNPHNKREWNLIEELISEIRKMPTIQGIRKKLRDKKEHNEKENSKISGSRYLYHTAHDTYMLEGTEIFARLVETFFCTVYNKKDKSETRELWNFNLEEIRTLEKCLHKIFRID